MTFHWLKRYMPRSLYGRAALILVLPVVTLQLVVSVVFIQRHFEGVTEQMSRVVSRELNLIADTMQSGQDVAALARALDYEIIETSMVGIRQDDMRRWYDFSGAVVIRTFDKFSPQIEIVQLPDDFLVRVFLKTGEDLVEIQFDRRRVSASNPHQLLVNMIVFGVLMTIIAFIYLRNQLRPVTRLARAAEAFGRGRVVPYSPSGATEVRAAGSAFLDMRARIERQIEQRTMMLSGVSHDLRTPLTRLRLGLSLLESEEREPLEQDVEEMQHLLDAFLSFARGDAQDGNAELTDPIELVTRVVEDAKRSGSDVELTAVEGTGSVSIRAVAVRRAIENLVGNAVRYGTRAEVSVMISEKSLRIRVEDDGPGIPAESREDALRPFVRLDPSRNQDKGSGVGLGLAIAADIARSHGGVLRLGESKRLGGLAADFVMAR